jgi:hypothetical protein
MSSVQDTKVDITSLNLEDHENATFLVCLNFNIPRDKQADAAQFQNLLSDISNFLQLNFLPDNQVTFQVTAAYYLKNRNTNEERLWVGSFFPGNRISLSGTYFQIFNPHTFPQKIRQSTEQERVLQHLAWNSLTTEWNFLSVASFIVNCQVVVEDNHGFLANHDLLTSRNRRQRRHVTLQHPW